MFSVVRPALFALLFGVYWPIVGRAQNTNSTSSSTSSPYLYVEQMPEYPGGQAEIMRHLAEHIKYPRRALKNGIRGKVYVQFTVDETGRVRDPSIMKGIGNGCDAEAIRVIRSLKPFKPGLQDGKPVAVFYHVPVSYLIRGLPMPTTHNVSFEPDPGVVYDNPEEPAQHLGLEPAAEGNLYSLPAAADGKKGIVEISLLINEQGKVTQRRLRSKLNPGADSAALQALANGEGWRPGVQGGLPVDSHYTHTITVGFDRRPEVYNAPAVPFQYPDGWPGLQYQLSQINPEVRRQTKTSGRVLVRAVVDANGQVTAPEVLNGLNPACDAEALRVVQTLVRFRPAQHQGKPVAAYLIVPVHFSPM